MENLSFRGLGVRSYLQSVWALNFLWACAAGIVNDTTDAAVLNPKVGGGGDGLGFQSP